MVLYRFYMVLYCFMWFLYGFIWLYPAWHSAHLFSWGQKHLSVWLPKPRRFSLAERWNSQSLCSASSAAKTAFTRFYWRPRQNWLIRGLKLRGFRKLNSFIWDKFGDDDVIILCPCWLFQTDPNLIQYITDFNYQRVKLPKRFACIRPADVSK